MTEPRAIVPPFKGDGFVELARSRKGRVFEKQILRYGDLLYPGVKGGKVHIDDKWADTLIANFSNGVCDIVQVPKADKHNDHTEDPDRNIGEVIGLAKRDGKIYAQIDARSEADADKLGKTLLGASAMMHLDYKDTRTGEKVGPTLLHVAVTNRPYVVELEDFDELLAASADGTSDAVFLTASNHEENEMPKTLDELFAELKADHNIDVPALQEKATHAESALTLSNKIQEELVGTGLLKLSNGEEATADVLIGAIAEAGDQLTKLSNRVDSLIEEGSKKEATAEVEKLVLSGHILTKDKDAMTELRLSNPDLFTKLVPEKPVVALSQERGRDEVESDAKNAQTEIDRLADIASSQRTYVRK